MSCEWLQAYRTGTIEVGGRKSFFLGIVGDGVYISQMHQAGSVTWHNVIQYTPSDWSIVIAMKPVRKR